MVAVSTDEATVARFAVLTVSQLKEVHDYARERGLTIEVAAKEMLLNGALPSDVLHKEPVAPLDGAAQAPAGPDA